MDGIQLRGSATETFVDLPTAPVKPPSPSPQKISLVDLNQYFEGESLVLDKIDPMVALRMLDYLINHLISKTDNEDDASLSAEDVGLTENSSSGEEDTPLSPRKRRYSSDDQYALQESKKHQSKSQEHALSKRFLLKQVPALDATQYLERINRYCGLSSAVYLTCMHYLYKLVVQLGILKLNRFNAHRLIIAGLRVSCKTIEDINHRQQFIAKIGGVKLDDLKFLEISFLFLLNFDCQSNATILVQAVENVRAIFKSSV